MVAMASVVVSGEPLMTQRRPQIRPLIILLQNTLQHNNCTSVLQKMSHSPGD